MTQKWSPLDADAESDTVLTDATARSGERIAKFLSSAGICSRRDAEKLIAEGRVKVNGGKLSSPACLVTPKDVVVVDGKKVKRRESGPRLWLYHKPEGLVTTHHDEQGRPTVFDALPAHLPRVISVGRLDLNSEGLLLLTTSGALSRALELPQNAMERTYRVRVRGTPTEKHLHMLARGVTIDGVRYRPMHIIAENEKTSGRNQWLEVTLSEGKNREIRRVFEHFDYPVSRLIRVAYGPWVLGDMKAGEVREVPLAQLHEVMEHLGVTGE